MGRAGRPAFRLRIAVPVSIFRLASANPCVLINVINRLQRPVDESKEIEWRTMTGRMEIGAAR